MTRLTEQSTAAWDRLYEKAENLRLLTSEQWDALLDRIDSAPVPRKVIRFSEPSLTRRKTLTQERFVKNSPKTAARNLDILARLEAGEKGADIARDLRVSPSLISRVAKGTR